MSFSCLTGTASTPHRGLLRRTLNHQQNRIAVGAAFLIATGNASHLLIARFQQHFQGRDIPVQYLRDDWVILGNYHLEFHAKPVGHRFRSARMRLTHRILRIPNNQPDLG
mgnify:CR=1 FL=1